MSWEWSHSPEAYESARKNFEKLSLTDLRIVWAEWKTYQDEQEDTDVNWMERYSQYLDEAKEEFRWVGTLNVTPRMVKEQLVDIMWPWVEEHATCTHGGHYAHVCPYGCNPHMVKMS